MNKSTLGLTLIELVIVSGITVILATTIILLLNPTRYLAQSRNARRNADVVIIANAIGQNIVDNRGVFSCAAGAISASGTRMTIGVGNYNIAPCLVPAYLDTLPYDPRATGANYTSTTSYDTVYAIAKNAATGRITISAIYPELGEIIAATR